MNLDQTSTPNWGGWQYPVLPAPKKCPTCGHCPTCGSHQPYVPPIPTPYVQPLVPYNQPPAVTYC